VKKDMHTEFLLETSMEETMRDIGINRKKIFNSFISPYYKPYSLYAL
jgi:hypothetical protein